MIVGFLCSSTSFDALQEEMTALERAGCERIVVDNATVPNIRSGMLAAVVERLDKNDCLVVWSFDSVANSVAALVELVTLLDGKDVRFKSLTESFDTHGRNRAAISAVFAQLNDFQTKLTLRLVKESHAHLGRRAGRPRALSIENIQQARARVEQGLTMGEVAKEFRVSKATLYRYLSQGG